MTGDTNAPASDRAARAGGEPGDGHDIVTVGEALAVWVAAGVGPLASARSFTLSAGGAELNTAIAASRLQAKTAWCGPLSRDSLGEFLRQRMLAAGVDVLASKTDAPTGILVRHRRLSTVDVVSYHRQGSAGVALAPGMVPEEVIRAARALHVTGITPALGPSARAAVFEAVEIASAAGVMVSFDVNYRRALWSPDAARSVLRDLSKRADLTFAGLEEAILLTGTTGMSGLVEMAAAMASVAGAEVVVRDGPHGAAAVIDDQVFEQPAFDVVLVDAIGAGDGFTAGYLAARVKDESPRRRLRQAAALGAFVAASDGDSEGSPSTAELRLLESSQDVDR